MGDYLSNLIARTSYPGTVLRPRPVSRFEPSPIAEATAGNPLSGESRPGQPFSAQPPARDPPDVKTPVAEREWLSSEMEARPQITTPSAEPAVAPSAGQADINLPQPLSSWAPKSLSQPPSQRESRGVRVTAVSGLQPPLQRQEIHSPTVDILPSAPTATSAAKTSAPIEAVATPTTIASATGQIKLPRQFLSAAMPAPLSVTTVLSQPEPDAASSTVGARVKRPGRTPEALQFADLDPKAALKPIELSEQTTLTRQPSAGSRSQQLVLRQPEAAVSAVELGANSSALRPDHSDESPVVIEPVIRQMPGESTAPARASPPVPVVTLATETIPRPNSGQQNNGAGLGVALPPFEKPASNSGPGESRSFHESASMATTSLAASEPPPTIQVTIGRVEVRAEPPPPPASKPRTRPAGMSLDEYLNQRAKGENR